MDSSEERSQTAAAAPEKAGSDPGNDSDQMVGRRESDFPAEGKTELMSSAGKSRRLSMWSKKLSSIFGYLMPTTTTPTCLTEDKKFEQRNLLMSPGREGEKR
ncbi:hypothetical protein MLD38_009817 [Melastoma candidum]|uniref:Uncharacterized protein n=1 Tax=Melastoma candidum TaxID=119954 RepID=A0ACB9RXW9_9MYRT|nr:hypothetical protein MLD38_009817 [Melastoma candidum]